MPKVSVGKKVPDFTLPATGEQNITLSDLRDKNVVIYFYPKDNTPGCTTEATDFRDRQREFAGAGCEVYGVSRDSLKSHGSFKAKMKLPFDLLSDAEETVCAQFGVIKLKNMYGKQVRGIERSTFLIDAAGKLHREWRKVKVDGHVDEVLEAIRELNRSSH